MSFPSVSVVIPVYNYADYVECCIKSVLMQNYPDLEIVVVDDKSSDDSLKIVKRFESDGVKVIDLPKNLGFPASKNEGIVASSGSYVITIDADDMLMPDSIEVRVAAAEKNDVPFIHARAVNIGKAHRLKHVLACDPKRYNLNKRVKIHAQTVLVSRWVYQKFGLYDETVGSPSDKEMWCRLLGRDYAANRISKKPLIPWKKIDNVVAAYRKHSSSMLAHMRSDPRRRAVREHLWKVVRMREVDGITAKNTRMLTT